MDLVTTIRTVWLNEPATCLYHEKRRYGKIVAVETGPCVKTGDGFACLNAGGRVYVHWVELSSTTWKYAKWEEGSTPWKYFKWDEIYSLEIWEEPARAQVPEALAVWRPRPALEA